MKEGDPVDNSMLVALNDSISSQAVIDFLAGLPLRRDEMNVTLVHVYRKPSAVEDLMGQRFTSEQPSRFMKMLEDSRNRLIERGFRPERVRIDLVEHTFPTVTDGIIDQFNKHKYDMVVIGRKNMSKAEEFVLGDISVKLVRALGEAAVLVVKTP
jgi:nucleotide-binding universal stress UspA family protein